MQLATLKIKNFRCYKNETIINFDSLTAIIGKNDSGKSTIMDALAIFFDEAKIEKNDGCVSGSLREVQISCEFKNLPSELILDENNSTTLASEYLLNANGNLEIRKTYDCSLATPKISIEAIAMHPTTEGYADLLQLKKTELRTRANTLNLNLENIDTRMNAPMRSAIWESCLNLALDLKAVSIEDEGTKQIWVKLAKYMPSFALFKSDRASTDQDAEAQDPLKAAIKDAIREVEDELQRIQNHVENEVRKIASATVEKIREMDPSLAITLNPVISTKKWDSLFQTSITGDNGIPLNKRGSGIKRLVLLNFFRAKAEKIAHEKHATSVIYAIEEPETSQHPHNQRMLMSALTQISAAYGNQVIVTTHTPMLARALPDTCLRFIEQETDGNRTIAIGGTTTNQKIASSLGILPDHSVKLFIGVEGKHDISFLKSITKILITAGENVPDLENLELKGELIFFPLGGSNLALWSSRLSPLNRPEYHICDRDYEPPTAPKYAEHILAINSKPDCRAVCTSKRELENYIHHEAISEAYQENGITLVFATPFQNFDDVPQLVAKTVHNANGGQNWENLSIEKQEKKISKAKSNLNTLAVSKMTSERLSAADANNEIRNWLSEIKAILDGNSSISIAA